MYEMERPDGVIVEIEDKDLKKFLKKGYKKLRHYKVTGEIGDIEFLRAKPVNPAEAMIGGKVKKRKKKHSAILVDNQKVYEDLYDVIQKKKYDLEDLVNELTNSEEVGKLLSNMRHMIIEGMFKKGYEESLNESFFDMVDSLLEQSVNINFYWKDLIEVMNRTVEREKMERERKRKGSRKRSIFD